jgi:hypothetical protein
MTKLIAAFFLTFVRQLIKSGEYGRRWSRSNSKLHSNKDTKSCEWRAADEGYIHIVLIDYGLCRSAVGSCSFCCSANNELFCRKVGVSDVLCPVLESILL